LVGLEAISNANGWAIAVAGSLIVMSGLTILSFVISQLPRLVALLDRGEERRKQKQELLTADASEDPAQKIGSYPSPSNADGVAEFVKPLAGGLGGTFELKELHKICQENGYPHAHLSIRTLWEAGILVPQGDGVFSWKN
jgi:hypothetical protein